MLAFARCGAFIAAGEAESDDGVSSPASPPPEAAADGFEKRRDAALVIMGSGGARPGAGASGTGAAGAGSAAGADPKGLTRLEKPGPEATRAARRFDENCAERSARPIKASSAPAAWILLSSSTSLG